MVADVDATRPFSLRRPTSTSSPAGEYLTALSSRFESSCRRRSRSPRTAGAAAARPRATAPRPARARRPRPSRARARRDRPSSKRKRNVPASIARCRARRRSARRGGRSRRDQREERLALLRRELAPALLSVRAQPITDAIGAAQLVRDEGDEVGAERREPAQLIDGRALRLVGADVLDGARRRGGRAASRARPRRR